MEVRYIFYLQTGKTNSVPLVDSVMTWIRRNAMFELFSSPKNPPELGEMTTMKSKDNCWEDGKGTWEADRGLIPGTLGSVEIDSEN